MAPKFDSQAPLTLWMKGTYTVPTICCQNIQWNLYQMSFVLWPIQVKCSKIPGEKRQKTIKSSSSLLEAKVISPKHWQKSHLQGARRSSQNSLKSGRDITEKTRPPTNKYLWKCRDEKVFSSDVNPSHWLDLAHKKGFGWDSTILKLVDILGGVCRSKSSIAIRSVTRCAL